MWLSIGQMAGGTVKVVEAGHAGAPCLLPHRQKYPMQDCLLPFPLERSYFSNPYDSVFVGALRHPIPFPDPLCVLRSLVLRLYLSCHLCQARDTSKEGGGISFPRIHVY